MPLLEAIRLALRTIRAQKLKSFFSLVGVLIGVTFLIAVVSIVQGMNRYMVDRFANTLVGANTFELRQRPSINMGHVTHETWLAWRRRPRVSYEDADFVRDRIRTPATFAKFCEDRVSVHYDGKVAKDIDLVGTEETYFRIRNYELTAGRAFTAQESGPRSRCLWWGTSWARSCFPASIRSARWCRSAAFRTGSSVSWRHRETSSESPSTSSP
jgi:putative ABC transport system permease protein